jgi:hypothetical protein
MRSLYPISQHNYLFHTTELSFIVHASWVHIGSMGYKLLFQDLWAFIKQFTQIHEHWGSGNTVNLYSGGALFMCRPGHKLS